MEVVDTPLDYKLLLGRSWFYTMIVVASLVFRCFQFPHQGKIVTIDQLSFFSSSVSNDNIPYVGNTEIPYESVGVGLFKDSYLMRTFSLPPP